MHSAAAVAHIAILAQAGFDQFGPVVCTRDTEFPALTVIAENGGGNLVHRVWAIVDDIHSLLHLFKRLETHEIRRV